MLNTATAAGTTPQRLDGTGGEPVTSPESTVEVPVPAPAPALEIEKLAVFDDLNGNGTADVGEKIAYTFAVANTGNVTLTDVTVDDPKAGAVTCAVTVLAPLEVTACIADEVYVVTAADVAAGGVHNVATAWGTAPDGTTQVQSAQAEVTTPTTVPAPAPAPAPAPTPAPAPVKPPALAATGSHGELLVPLALALLAFGALTVLVTRRRSTQS
ncbi:hypothetical protein H4P1_00033 (plasmid) [Variovorax sp. PBS-H4]|nr:hypothetical protein H4P1_00033 [Variovorax sp. PBS-H4]